MNFRMEDGALSGTACFDTSLHEPAGVKALLGGLSAFIESAATTPAGACLSGK